MKIRVFLTLSGNRVPFRVATFDVPDHEVELWDSKEDCFDSIAEDWANRHLDYRWEEVREGDQS